MKNKLTSSTNIFLCVNSSVLRSKHFDFQVSHIKKNIIIPYGLVHPGACDVNQTEEVQCRQSEL